MDLGSMRAWMKQHQETYLMTERTYRTMVDEQETDVVEFRVVMLRGDMDYTAAVLETRTQIEADRTAAEQHAFTRLQWETKRDTGVEIDCAHARENGRQYQSGR